MLDAVAHSCNPISWDTEAGGSVVLCQPGIQREFQTLS
jgi:hypothetical protein